MDSSKAAASLETSSPPCGAHTSAVKEAPLLRLTPRRKGALLLLLEALECAQDLGCSAWDFAAEMSTMRRLKLSNSELRWLIAKGLVEHALEVTLGSDSQRTFRHPVRPIFCKETCFVLSDAGAIVTRGLNGKSHSPSDTTDRGGSNLNGIAAVQVQWLSVATEPESLVPKWDRDRQELRVGSIVVKRYQVPAASQESILAAFEEESWPPRIDDPLPPHPDQSSKRRLQITIDSLNRNQKRHLIRFLGDGSGQGVRWEFCGDKEQAASEA